MNHESDVKGKSEVGESSHREHNNQRQNRGSKNQWKVVKSESENSDEKSLSPAKSYARAVMGSKNQCKVVKSESENSDVKSLSPVKSYARAVMGK